MDENRGKVGGTTTYILDVASLTEPGTPLAYQHDNPSIDHNLYIHEGYIYEANYTAGLRILDFDHRSLRRGELTEVAYFDVFPAADVTQYGGSWSSYPFFASGTVVVSSIDSGLFVLRPNLPAKGPGEGSGDGTGTGGENARGAPDTGNGGGNGGGQAQADAGERPARDASHGTRAGWYGKVWAI